MEEGVKVKRGYSIWSLLVLTTLIAVVLAIPRRIASGRVLFSFFILSHQVSLWLLVGLSCGCCLANDESYSS